MCAQHNISNPFFFAHEIAIRKLTREIVFKKKKKNLSHLRESDFIINCGKNK